MTDIGNGGAAAPSGSPPIYLTSPPATATSRQFGYNSNGDPEIYPSDIEMLRTQYGLTAPEAELFWEQSVVGGGDADTTLSSIRGARTIYQQVWAATPAETSVHNALISSDAPESDAPTGAVLEG